MSNNFKIEGGQGGNRGHSNMSHWAPTEEIKEVSKKLRRKQSKELERKARNNELE